MFTGTRILVFINSVQFCNVDLIVRANQKMSIDLILPGS
jgi:hypothetical protein